MYLNNSAPNPIPTRLRPTISTRINPDYLALVKFLLLPFLEYPETLALDCELSQANTQVWIRIAFEGDKGRVFGRGGRNLQAISSILEAVGKAAGQFVHLDIYGGIPQSGKDTIIEIRGTNNRRFPDRRPTHSRQNNPRDHRDRGDHQNRGGDHQNRGGDRFRPR
jgi:uncharacterized protein